MKRILWFSRHTPLPGQVADLRTAFGADMLLLQDHDVFTDAEDVVRRMRQQSADDICIVAPLSVIERLVGLDVRPVRPIMRVIARPQSPDPSRQVEANGRWYEHVGFERVFGVQWDVRPLLPAPDSCPACYWSGDDVPFGADGLCTECGWSREHGPSGRAKAQEDDESLNSAARLLASNLRQYAPFVTAEPVNSRFTALSHGCAVMVVKTRLAAVALHKHGTLADWSALVQTLAHVAVSHPMNQAVDDSRWPSPNSNGRRSQSLALGEPFTRALGNLVVMWDGRHVRGTVGGVEVWALPARRGELLELRGAQPETAKPRLRADALGLRGVADV